MSRNTFAISLIAGSLALAGAAYASEQNTPKGSHHESHATVDTRSAAASLPVAAVLEKLAAQGYGGFTEIELDDSKYELEGRDAEGREVEIDVDARTGAILKAEQD